MKYLKIILIGLVLSGVAGTAAAQAPVQFRVQLIAADQQAGPSDPALSALLPKLQRMPYKRFLQKGSRIVTLAPGKTVHAAMAGHNMALTLESVQGSRLRVHVNWRRGRTSVVNITAATQPGSPF
ncbi:MAG TPA: hypothetical protein VJ904_02370, partial [Tichowtungia sp.]|nr:hypothetical protein [Tichowtungia sp.]